MHTRGEAVVVGDAGEQGAQLCALAGVEAAADCVVVRPAHGSDPPEELAPVRCQVQGVQSAVGRVAAALDEATLGEHVDETDQPARWGPEQLRHGLLALPGRGRDRSEQPGLRGRQVQGGDPLGELAGGVRTERGEQERRPCN